MTDGNIVYLVFIIVIAVGFMSVLGWAERRTRK